MKFCFDLDPDIKPILVSAHCYTSYQDYVRTQKEKTTERLLFEKRQNHLWSPRINIWHLACILFNFSVDMSDGARLNAVTDFSIANSPDTNTLAPVFSNANKQQGLCHGTRHGYEQFLLRKLLNSDNIFGTEITEAAHRKAHTIIHDFNVQKDEWVGSMDFVYSNSHDHSFDLIATINVWSDQLKANGILVLEHCRSHGIMYSDKYDPTAIESELLPYYILDQVQSLQLVGIVRPIHEYDVAHRFFVFRRSI